MPVHPAHLNIAPCLSLLIEDLGKALHGTGGHLQLEMVPSSQGALVDACLHVLKVGCRRPKPYSLQVNCIWALGVMTSAALMQAPVEAMFAFVVKQHLRGRLYQLPRSAALADSTAAWCDIQTLF